ncbi:MAG TPA: cache domain-containing protein [Clostridiales bacterium]|nr:cache domain-containing protein [Clostridiales bacterium]
MKNFHKLRGFIMYQFLASFVIVLICTLISSAVSYQVLREEMSQWLIDNNNKVLEQYSETIDTLIASNSNEVYKQILNDISMVESMKYYLYFPLKDNIMDTLKINKYLSSIKESNQLIQSVGIFYVDNNLLISSDKIRYDLFYEYRRKELQLYSDVLNASSKRKNSFYNIADQSTLCMMRPIVSGGKINALFVINYSLGGLRERLRNVLPSDFGNFFVVDSDNTVIFDIDGVNAAENLFNNSVYARVFSEPYGVNTYSVEIEGEPSIVSYKNYGEGSGNLYQ